VLLAHGHRVLHPWVGAVTAGLIEDCHRAGVAVNTWTCDDPARMAQLIGWGIDGLCTNVPDVALAVRSDRPVGNHGGDHEA
jgi:glycerophosphoryl diester phosphodiesterase